MKRESKTDYRTSLYRELTGASETVFLRQPDRKQVFVIRQDKAPNHSAVIDVPAQQTEIIGWFHGRQVVRLRD